MIINCKKIKKRYFCIKIMFLSIDKIFNVRLFKFGYESVKNEVVNV